MILASGPLAPHLPVPASLCWMLVQWKFNHLKKCRRSKYFNSTSVQRYVRKLEETWMVSTIVSESYAVDFLDFTDGNSTTIFFLTVHCTDFSFLFLSFRNFCTFSRVSFSTQMYWVWQYGLWCFEAGGTQLERFLHKNQHTQRKLLNFEFWINGELSKIGHHFSNKVI